MIIDDEIREATRALEYIFDGIEEIDLRELTEDDKAKVRKLADLCSEFGVHFNAV